jgi:hypothetical protein
MEVLNAWASLLFKWIGNEADAEMFLAGTFFWLFASVFWFKDIKDENNAEDQEN